MKSVPGKMFADNFDFVRARISQEHLVGILKKIKEIFPDPLQVYTLKDLNRISARLEKNLVHEKFEMIKNKPYEFVHNIIL